MYLSFVVFILYMSLCKLIVEEGGSSLNELVKMNCVDDITKCGVIVLLKNNDTGGTLGMHANDNVTDNDTGYACLVSARMLHAKVFHQFHPEKVI